MSYRSVYGEVAICSPPPYYIFKLICHNHCIHHHSGIQWILLMHNLFHITTPISSNKPDHMILVSSHHWLPAPWLLASYCFNDNHVFLPTHYSIYVWWTICFRSVPILYPILIHPFLPNPVQIIVHALIHKWSFWNLFCDNFYSISIKPT